MEFYIYSTINLNTNTYLTLYLKFYTTDKINKDKKNVRIPIFYDRS